MIGRYPLLPGNCRGFQFLLNSLQRGIVRNLQQPFVLNPTPWFNQIEPLEVSCRSEHPRPECENINGPARLTHHNISYFKPLPSDLKGSTHCKAQHLQEFGCHHDITRLELLTECSARLEDNITIKWIRWLDYHNVAEPGGFTYRVAHHRIKLPAPGLGLDAVMLRIDRFGKARGKLVVGVEDNVSAMQRPGIAGDSQVHIAFKAVQGNHGGNREGDTERENTCLVTRLGYFTE